MLAAAAVIRASKGPIWELSGNFHPKDILRVLKPNGDRDIPVDGEALTVAVDVLQAWAVILTLTFTLVIFFFLAFCVCAKRESRYNDFETNHGITTVKVCAKSGENGTTIPCSSTRATDETSEASSRYTHKRELPAIPTSSSAKGRMSSEHSSDLYASVNDTGQAHSGGVKLIGGVQVYPAGAPVGATRPAAKEAFQEPARSTVPQPQKHTYEKVTKPKKEHAYARVIHGDVQDNETDTDNYDDPQLIAKATSTSTASTQQTQPCMVTTHETMLPQAERPVTIPAAMAISGQTRANEELPYMTPPSQTTRTSQITQSVPVTQENYSGDSQDSRGYTSISVREPLSVLKAGQKAQPTTKPESYYMSVSNDDDSTDETYACIDEGSQNSRTYAKLTSKTPPATSPQQEPPPAPPSVDSLKNVVHSRQASASSAASTGMSSPVGERRAAKSPLPPVPQGDADLYSQSSPAQPPISPKSPIVSFDLGRPIEEMYAKVNKKKGHSRGGSNADGDMSPSRRNSTDIESRDMSSSMIEQSTKPSLPTDISASWTATKVYDEIKPKYTREPSDPGYETVRNDPPYASVDSENYPSYEVVKQPSEHGYETVKQKTDPDYEIVREKAEPSYETVKETETVEPGYETLKDKIEPSYETVKDTEKVEPSYETVQQASEPGYETVPERFLQKSDYDPGYEELSHARTESESDPNYEQLQFASTEPSYEVVGKTEGTYERVSDYETQEPIPPPVDIPLYATVMKKESPLKSLQELIPSSLLIDTGEDICPAPESKDTYPVTESPDDVELPPMEGAGERSKKDDLEQQTTDILDLLTSNIEASAKTLEPCLSPQEPELLLDPEMFPPPPAAVINDLPAPSPPLPPPVDDIVGCGYIEDRQPICGVDMLNGLDGVHNHQVPAAASPPPPEDPLVTMPPPEIPESNGINVVVNPMAHMGPIESQSSGSGGGSVESVVTVEANRTEVSASASPNVPLQHSTSTSSSSSSAETKEGGDGVTPV